MSMPSPHKSVRPASDLATGSGIPAPSHPLAPTQAVRAVMEAKAAGAVSVKKYEAESGVNMTLTTIRFDVPRVVVPANRPLELRALDAVEQEGFSGTHYLPGELEDDNTSSIQAWALNREPTPGQARMMLAVERSLAKGAFYLDDVKRDVMEDLGDHFFSKEAMIQFLDKPEGSQIGYEIYSARNAYEERLAHAKNRIAAEGIEPGMVFKNKRTGGHNFTSLKVVAVDKEHGVVSLQGTKRGSRYTYDFTRPANHEIFAKGEEA